MTTIYLFDPETFEHTGEMEAKRDALGNEKLPAAFHKGRTLEQPPTPDEGHASVWDWQNQTWTQAEDHRGKTVYDKVTREAREYKALGALPDEVTLDEPGPYDRWSDGGWVEDGDLKRAATVPPSITRRQLLIGLKANALISAQEAVAAAKDGSVPSAIQAIFDNLPTQDERDNAAITWASMSVAERNHPLVTALAQANQMTEQQIDEFFIACAEI